ncbi:hypothetical protein DEO72_LG3g536 [Vigna unguiculata]|uniref:Uncharacterized protein n=1 Tax=Vigna unguiculata TaxID=3917 RepID=A0A4D6LCB6_VIGUN|nr:hypothetical protein DEO72_LG3g536 [Vigna unguiculata]
MGVSRICSHQQVDDHRKREYPTTNHTTKKTGQGLKTGAGKQRGISLRRDRSRLGELFARSKIGAGRLGDLSRKLVWESTNIQTQHCLAQLLAQAEGSRSGETVSLRRDSLAQASPPPPRQGLKTGAGKQRGISLRRDPSRLGELFARSKIGAGRLGDLSRKLVWVSLRQTRLGESDSPGRD